MHRLITYFNKVREFLAQSLLKKYRPSIIAIAGAAGKTMTKETAYVILRQARRTQTGDNFLKTILGTHPVKKLFIKGDYPEILLLEYTAGYPGHIRELLKVARPQIAVITNTSDIGSEAVIREKSRVVEALPTAGFAILNIDDSGVMAMQEKTKAHITTFGFDKRAQVRISNFSNRSEQLPNGQWRPAGISFRLEYESNFVPIRLNGVFGKAHAYAAAAAAAIGLSFGINLVRIAEALHYYQAPPQRMKLIPGVKGTFIINDSYSASLLSMRSALETIGELKAERKVAVLGDMLGLGKYAIEAHEAVSEFCRDNVNILITVGPRAKFIANAAIKVGFDKRKILSFNTADEAKLEVQGLLKKGDLILIKGSKETELEKIVREIQLI